MNAPRVYVPSGPQEVEFLASYDASDYDRPSVTVDVVLLTIRDGQLCVLLIQRADFPFQGSWALPGGFLEADENADQGAARELREETGVSGHLEQLGAYSEPGRDPRTRVVSLAYLALLPEVQDPVAGSDAKQARFWPVQELRDSGLTLAFDHELILSDALARAAGKVEYTTVATAFCDDTFTLAELRRVYEAVWGRPVDARNFRRKVLGTPGFLIPADVPPVRTTGGRPAALFRAGEATWLMPPLMRVTMAHRTSTTSDAEVGAPPKDGEGPDELSASPVPAS